MMAAWNSAAPAAGVILIPLYHSCWLLLVHMCYSTVQNYNIRLLIVWLAYATNDARPIMPTLLTSISAPHYSYTWAATHVFAIMTLVSFFYCHHTSKTCFPSGFRTCLLFSWVQKMDDWFYGICMYCVYCMHVQYALKCITLWIFDAIYLCSIWKPSWCVCRTRKPWDSHLSIWFIYLNFKISQSKIQILLLFELCIYVYRATVCMHFVCICVCIILCVLIYLCMHVCMSVCTYVLYTRM